MNKLQYDDIYTEWINSTQLMYFSDPEEEECYARTIMKNVHSRCL